MNSPISDTETNGIKQKECVNELSSDMHLVTVYRKDKIKQFGKPNRKWTLPYKFICYVFDGYNTYKCIFDACHTLSFSAGDEIGFNFKIKEVTYSNIDHIQYLVYKKHSVFNKTVFDGKDKEYIMRPKEEVEHLQKKANKRYEEIKNSLMNHPPIQTAVALRAEKSDLVKLMGILTYAQNGKIIEHPDVNPKLSFKGCSIVTRYLGEEGEDFVSILERAERRFETISKTAINAKEGDEYANLRKLIVSIKWILDQATDTQVGLNFGWGIFGKKLQDDFKLEGTERDEYKIPTRAREDKNFLIEEIRKNDEHIKDKKQEEKLKDRFSFLQKKGIPTKK